MTTSTRFGAVAVAAAWSVLLVCCTERAVTPVDAGLDALPGDAGPPDAGEEDASWRITRPRSSACIDIDLGSALGEGLGTQRVDALDDDAPYALCSTNLYRACEGILPVESTVRWQAPERGYYELRARGVEVFYLGIDIAVFASDDAVACRDASDVTAMAEPGFGQTPLDVGWFCDCQLRPPGAREAWATAPLRTVTELPAGAIVLVTLEATPDGPDAEIGVDIRRVESCDSGVDDDGDGDVDCRDSDCPFSNYGVPTLVCNERDSCAMPAPGTTCCGNGIDDDGDGESDCVDQQCSGTDGCAPETECGDGLDDDLDLHVDCDDADCRFAVGCYDPGGGEADCANGADDDGDGGTDCDDPDCVYPGSACFGVYENAHAGECEDGLDNDGDGRVDCADVDCRRDSFACLDREQYCSDGEDDDLDDAVDCADADCRGVAACVEVACDDGTDDDGDGRMDCEDVDCLCFGDCPCR